MYESNVFEADRKKLTAYNLNSSLKNYFWRRTIAAGFVEGKL